MARETRLLVLSILIATTISMMVTPVFAGGHLVIDSNRVGVATGKLGVQIKVTAPIPIDGSAGAFGYGVLTDGNNNALVLVTHLPIDDTAFENKVSGFHTHVLDMTDAFSAACPAGTDKEIVLATVTDPGYPFNVGNKLAQITNVPVTDLADGTAETVASLTVAPIFSGSTLTNLCVNLINTQAANQFNAPV